MARRLFGVINGNGRDEESSVSVGTTPLELDHGGTGTGTDTRMFFPFNSLRAATQNFKTHVGCGKCADVYKGILPDGRAVAVKKLKSKQYGYTDGFLPVVDHISRLKHRNVVQMLGCCVDNGQQIIVCEYAYHGDLRKVLIDSERKEAVFNWEKRVSVCIGIARGLSYLHEDVYPGVIHRDIKSANILLDEDFNPKIADFDLVHFVCGPPPDLKSNEYNYDKLDTSYKVDVYSFGVVMLEIISGRSRAVDHDQVVSTSTSTTFDVDVDGDDAYRRSLVNWVSQLQQNGRLLEEVVDPMLMLKLADSQKAGVKRLLDVALSCIQPSLELRPNSMFQVLLMLCGEYLPATTRLDTTTSTTSSEGTDHREEVAVAQSKHVMMTHKASAYNTTSPAKLRNRSNKSQKTVAMFHIDAVYPPLLTGPRSISLDSSFLKNLSITSSQTTVARLRQL